MSTGSHDHPEMGPSTLVEVGEDVYAYIQPDGSWFINNTGFVAGTDGVISVDACSTEKRTRAFMDQIKTVTTAPITTLINTHHHGDHTHGNSVIEATTIVAHENTRIELIKHGIPGNQGIWDPIDFGDLTVTPPNLTFKEGVTLWSNDRPVDITYVGQPAHTNNDSLVWLPEQEVLFCGDLLFNGGTPFLLMGSVQGAIDVLDTVIRPIPAKVIVPGHGAPCDHALIDTMIGYLRFVLASAGRGRAAGLTPLECARETDLGEYAGWLDAERIVGNLHRAYADLDPDHATVDVFGALQDMITFNGGRPLTCYA